MPVHWSARFKKESVDIKALRITEGFRNNKTADDRKKGPKASSLQHNENSKNYVSRLY